MNFNLENKDFFEKNGYVILRALYSHEEISQIKSAIDRLIQTANQICKDLEWVGEKRFLDEHKTLYVLKKPSAALDPQILRIVGCGGSEATLLEMSRKAELLRVFGDLFGVDKFEQIICQSHIKKPHDGVSFDPHRDVEFRKSFDPEWKDILQNGSYAVACIAVDDCSAENGGLEVVPGSHHEVVSLEHLELAKNTLTEEQKSLAIIPILQKGDVLIMHAHLIHWSRANVSEQSRYTLLSGLCAVGANHAQYPGSRVNEIVQV